MRTFLLKRRIFTIGWAILWLSRAFNIMQAQNPPLGANEVPDYHIISYTTSNGLSSNAIKCMEEDDYGFLWIGTDDGLNRFDGTNFIKYFHDPKDTSSLSSSNISAIKKDSRGRLWIATLKGLTNYDPITGRFRRFPYSFMNEKGDREQRIFKLIVDKKDRVWFEMASRTDLFMYDPGQNKFHRFSCPPGDVASQRVRMQNFGFLLGLNIKCDTALWLTGGGDGLWSFNTETLTFDRHKNFIRHPEKKYNRIVPLFTDSEGELYCGSKEDGVWIYRPKKRRWTQYDRENVFGYDQLPITDSTFICSKLGIYYFNKNTKSTYPVSLSAGQKKWVEFLGVGFFNDKKGAIWMISNIGLLKLEAKTSPFRFQYLNRFIYDVYDSRPVDGNLYAPDKFSHKQIKYLFKINDSTGKIDSIANAAKKPFTSIRKILEDRLGKLWILSGRDVFTLNRQSGQFKDMHFPDDPLTRQDNYYLLDAAEDNDGAVWLTAPSWHVGLFRYEPGRRQWKKISQAYGFEGSPWRLLMDKKKNCLWISAQGLWKYDFETKKFSHVLQSEKKHGYFPEGEIFDLALDDAGDLWLAMSGVGLARYREVKAESRWALDSFGLECGLQSLRYGRLLKDRQGKIWAAFENGQGLTVFDPKTRSSRHFDERYFFRNNRFSELSPSADTSEIFIGSDEGFYRFRPGDLEQKKSRAPIFITDFKVFDREKVFQDGVTAQFRPTIRLEYAENFFSFDFTTPDFSPIKETKYIYLLENFDRGWIQSGTRTFASYSNVPPGDYRFRIRTVGADGAWDAREKSVALHIETPWFLSWKFWALVCLITVYGAYRFLRYRWRLKMTAIQQKIDQDEETRRKLENERNRIALEMHDDLGSGLSSIWLLSERAKAGVGDEQKRRQIEKIGTEARSVVENMGLIIWAMNSRNDSVGDTVLFMRKYASEYLETNQIECVFRAPVIENPTQIYGEKRRNLFLVFKEALHNLVKHAQGGRAVIDVQIENNIFTMQIWDEGWRTEYAANGVLAPPFKTAVYAQGNGLASMKKRMAAIGGSFEIAANEDEKWVVTVTAPLAEAVKN